MCIGAIRHPQFVVLRTNIRLYIGVVSNADRAKPYCKEEHFSRHTRIGSKLANVCRLLRLNDGQIVSVVCTSSTVQKTLIISCLRSLTHELQS
jgi:hypothetical protein